MARTYPYYVQDSIRIILFRSPNDCLTVSQGVNGKYFIGCYNDPGTIAYYVKLPEATKEDFAIAFMKALHWIDEYIPQSLKQTINEIK